MTTQKVLLAIMVGALIGFCVIAYVGSTELAQYRKACEAHGGTPLREGCYVISDSLTPRQLGLRP